jgi:hypothetical protein
MSREDEGKREVNPNLRIVFIDLWSGMMMHWHGMSLPFLTKEEEEIVDLVGEPHPLCLLFLSFHINDHLHYIHTQAIN